MSTVSFDSLPNEVLWKIFREVMKTGAIGSSAETLEEREGEEYSMDSMDEDETNFDPLLVEGTPKKREFLKCREVCKRWLNNADTLYENHPLHLSLDIDPLNLQPTYLPLSKELGWNHDGIRFRCTLKIRRFLATVNWNTARPFLVTCVEFEDDGKQTFWNLVTKFLRVFGQHVKYIYLRLKPNNPKATSVENILRKCLILVPNLKKLFLDVSHDWIKMIREDPSEQERITAYLDDKPLPSLKDLKMLSFNTNLPTPLHTQIMRCGNKSLKKLDFPNYIYDGCVYYPKLEEVFTKTEKFEDLNNLAHFPKSMKKILLGTVNYDNFEVSVQQAFGILHRFSETLKEVFLEMQLVSSGPEFRAKLPCLKKLTLRLRGSLDFLQDLKNLEYLDVFEYLEAEPGKSSLIQVHGLETKMLNSNIWEVLPSLQTLEWEGVRFERGSIPVNSIPVPC